MGGEVTIEEEFTPPETLANKLIDVWCAHHGGMISWRKCVEIIHIICKTPDEEHARLLAMQDEPVYYYADRIAFLSSMQVGKGCDVWPKAGDYTERTGRELIKLVEAI